VTDIEKQVEALRYAPNEVQKKVRAIYAATLHESRHIRTGNFDVIAAEDVERLYRRYDDTFFSGLFQRLLSREGEGPLTFRVSRTMTSAGGKTTRLRRRAGSPGGGQAVAAYDLAVSATLLFQTFRGEDRPIVVAGITCADRLEALQRIVEHEMIHLLELLVWRTSSCARERFQQLARNLFAHTHTHHELVTPREIAHEQGIKVGERVTFEYQGVRYTGRVNQITKRVTVLVEHPTGSLYSDGKRYLKFYVPLGALELANA
jgi:hypothetical protein